jgi:hypothetical protein
MARETTVGILVELIAVDLVGYRGRLLCLGGARMTSLFSIGAIDGGFASSSIGVVPRMAS